MAISYTITQDGQEITYTIRQGVGPAGPNNITTSTGTDITGILKGDGSNVGAAVALTDYDIPAVVKSASFTADNGGRYSVVATGTVTDPSPVEGKGFEVFVRNGTATVGGTAYATAGTVIRRVYHSGAWANYVYKVDSTYVAVTGAQTVAGVKTFTDAPVFLSGATIGQSESFTPNFITFKDSNTTNSALLTAPSIGSNKTITLPAETGTLALTGQANGTIRNTDLDYANTADIGADLADADEVFVSDGGGNTTRRKTALSRVWTYIESKIDADFDADASAYFAAVEATGVTISRDQKRAINDFYLEAKAGSFYTPIKRLYLPIWGSASANAIDMISLGSGTFGGTVTHALGYMQGNGSTGYFSIGTSPNALGLTTSSGHVMVLQKSEGAAGDKVFIGSRGAALAGECSIARFTSINYGIVSREPAVAAPSFAATASGILLANRTSTTAGSLNRRSSDALTTASDATDVSSNTVTSVNLYVMGMNDNGSLSYPSDAQVGVVSVGLGISNVGNYLSAVRTLWQNCTGLSLP